MTALMGDWQSLWPNVVFLPRSSKGRHWVPAYNCNGMDCVWMHFFFGETPSRIVLSVSSEHVDRIFEVAQEFEVVAADIGEVGGSEYILDVQGDGNEPGCHIQVPIGTLHEQWSQSLEQKLQE